MKLKLLALFTILTIEVISFPKGGNVIAFFFIVSYFSLGIFHVVLEWKEILFFNPSTSTDHKIGFVNSTDPDETAHNKPAHQKYYCFPFFFFILNCTISYFAFKFCLPYIFQTMDSSKFKRQNSSLQKLRGEKRKPSVSLPGAVKN